MSDSGTLGQRIARRLDELGLSAVEAASRCGIHVDYIRKIMRGERQNPSGDVLQKIATGLNLPMQSLLDIPDPEPLPLEQLLLDRYGQAMKEAHEQRIEPEIILAQIRLLARVKSPGQ